ncbi:hypothetical protein ACP2AV_14710 [Aliiroseovarius sp. PTFE2010]
MRLRNVLTSFTQFDSDDLALDAQQARAYRKV